MKIEIDLHDSRKERPTHCNCCAAEEVCRFKEDYESGLKQIEDIIKCNPTIEVSIKCPHMIPKSATPTFR